MKTFIQTHFKPLIISATVFIILLLDALNIIYIPEWVGAILGGLAVYWMMPKVSPKTTTLEVATPIVKASAKKPRKKVAVVTDDVKKK